jgi:hypothetical protein
VWHGPGVGFVSRKVWAGIRRESGLRNRLVILDPKGIGFDDLLELVTRSPSHVHYFREVAIAIVKQTASRALLVQWAATRDVQFRRIVLGQLQLAEKAASAAE